MDQNMSFRSSPFWEPQDRLSILQLVRSGTLDLPLASLLWLMMDRRPSVMVVSKPRLAGKTTLLNALLDFLRPEVRQVYLRGRAEDFSFVGRADPSSVYLVAAEISDHLRGRGGT
ncbi:MAG: hypothetical protein HY664_02610 [Chloroflexi bacterium]|nr:hypothetical protein [Chloroflexota bacterium]